MHTVVHFTINYNNTPISIIDIDLKFSNITNLLWNIGT